MANEIIIIDYSARAVAVPGGRDSVFADVFESLGGRHNTRLSFGAGWIFSKEKSADALRAMFSEEELTPREIDKETANVIFYDSKPAPRPTGNKRATRPALPLLTDDEKRAAGIDVKDYALKLGDVVITHSPRPLETRFCFGYSHWSGPTSEEARESANNARTNPDYFISENLSELNNMLEKISGKGERAYLWLANWSTTPTRYNWGYEFSDVPHDKPEWLDHTERRLYDDGLYKPISSEDKQTLSEFVKFLVSKREKRCRAYLKRFGLGKLHVWTFDSDY